MAKEAKMTAIVETAPAAETYDVSEIAANAPRLFGYSKDIATAAFDYTHTVRCTLAEAKQIIKTFAERKVD